MGFENLDIEGVAKEYLDCGQLVDGYTLILLQQIREELRKIKWNTQ